MKKLRKILWIVTAFILTGLIGWTGSSYFYNQTSEEGSTFAVVRSGKNIGTPDLGGPFSLVDHAGAPRTDKDFRGLFMLVYFGYSFCPDICPTALQNMSEALDILGNQARAIQPLFITVDPARDTVEQMASYRRNFHKSFVMLTGSESQVGSAKKAYKVYAALAPNDGSSTDDLIDHSSIVYLMDRSGKFVAHFNHETPAEEIVRGIRAAF